MGEEIEGNELEVVNVDYKRRRSWENEMKEERAKGKENARKTFIKRKRANSQWIQQSVPGINRNYK